MSIDPNIPGGDDPTNPSGNPGGNPEDDKDKSKGTVSYDSHKKLLDEKKSLAKRLEDFEKREKERLDQDLKQKEDWKKLVEVREKEANEFKSKFETLSSEIEQSRKLRSFLGHVSGTVDEHYWPLISLDDIAVDPETGKPDEASVKVAVKEFEKLFPEVIKPKGGGPKAPNGPAAPPAGKLTHEDWLKLPYAEKKKRLHEVL
jgi:transposase